MIGAGASWSRGRVAAGLALLGSVSLVVIYLPQRTSRSGNSDPAARGNFASGTTSGGRDEAKSHASSRQRGIEKAISKYSPAKIERIAPEARTEQDLSMMAEFCSIEDFEAAWQILNTSGLSDSARYRILGELVQHCASKGGFDVISAKLSEIPESGAWKNSLQSGLYFAAKEPLDKLIAKASELQYEDESNAAIVGIANRVRWNSLDTMDFTVLGSENKHASSEIAKALGERLLNVERMDRGGDFSNTVSQFERLEKSGAVSPELVGKFLQGAASGAPKEAWSYWSQLPQDSVEKYPNAAQITRDLSNGLVKADGKGALDNLLASNSPAISKANGVLGNAFSAWMTLDQSAALKWLEGKNLSAMDGKKSDQLVNSIISFNMENGQIDAAEEWAKQLKGKEMADSINKRIAERRKSANK